MKRKAIGFIFAGLILCACNYDTIVISSDGNNSIECDVGFDYGIKEYNQCLAEKCPNGFKIITVNKSYKHTLKCNP
jgi:hypothetical protein